MTAILLFVTLLPGIAPQIDGLRGHEDVLQVRVSRIPDAGNGLFAKADLPAGTYLGYYDGLYITPEVHSFLYTLDAWHYVMGLHPCALARLAGYSAIDGVHGNVFTRMNYAPAPLQNVRFQKVCWPPFVWIVTTRDIAAGEELYVDYGPNYRYDFMEYPSVKAHFAKALRAQGSKTRR